MDWIWKTWFFKKRKRGKEGGIERERKRVGRREKGKKRKERKERRRKERKRSLRSERRKRAN